MPDSSKPCLGVAIAGVGTVGQSLVTLLHSQRGLIRKVCGRPVRLVAFSARRRKRCQAAGVDRLLQQVDFEKDASSLALRGDVDIVVELIGGRAGMAKKLVEASLRHGKHVVTANKALLAHHGMALAARAEKAACALNYEAAVVGSIPVIKTLREAFFGDTITSVGGIFNGTSNYILSQMARHQESFVTCLAKARHLGYAEANAKDDIDGTDAACKLALLASLAFKTKVSLSHVSKQGIRDVTAYDHQVAGELGFAIKLMARADKRKKGITQTVAPVLLPLSSPMAHVTNNLNAISITSRQRGTTFMQGFGAGGVSTATAVLSDILDIARQLKVLPFGMASAGLSNFVAAPPEDEKNPYYVRLFLKDKAGSMASLTKTLAKSGISIDKLVQKAHKANRAGKADWLPVALISYAARKENIRTALQNLKAKKSTIKEPLAVRIVSKTPN